MANYFTQIKAQLKTILQTSTKAKVVYDYVEPKPSGYPAVIVTPFESTSEFLDTTRNREGYIFKFNVQQERVEIGASEAERIITSLVDEIISIFDSSNNFNIGNTVVFAHPVQTKWGYISAPDVDVRSCEITIECVAAQ